MLTTLQTIKSKLTHERNKRNVSTDQEKKESELPRIQSTKEQEASTKMANYTGVKIRRETRTERADRQRREKKILFYTGMIRNVFVAGAILFFIAVLGHVGNNDLEAELINQGYTQAEAKELMR